MRAFKAFNKDMTCTCGRGSYQYEEGKTCKEDKALGKKSNALRIKELGELRKNGNRVWHGVLQGKLLADVLEADFMPVVEEAQ